MSIREEFEKAFPRGDKHSDLTEWEYEIAIKAAKWMAERCAKECQKESTTNMYGQPIGEGSMKIYLECRMMKLAQELSR